MAGQVKAIPDGFSSITPHLVVKDGPAAIEFYKKAFGAEEIMRMPGPDGKGLMHGEIKIGNAMVMLAGEFPGAPTQAPTSLNGTTVAVMIYSTNTDAAFEKATKAGATPVMPPMDMFWGDRFAQVKDPFGHVWSIATHQEDVSPEECGKRMKEAFAGGGGCGKPQ
ncbi:MAG TPA: VOC family protein [Phycisphaerae bacterium]|nr:VOC family protein [Phycisphaerae bacterium]